MGILDKFRKKETKKQLNELSKKKAAPTAVASSTLKKKETSERPKEKKPQSNVSAARRSESHRVLIRPIITEKSSLLGTQNQYVFEVHPSVNKHQVRLAIQDTYGVRPVSVRMQNYAGKRVRYGRTFGATKAWKRAIVALKKGDTIQQVEHA